MKFNNFQALSEPAYMVNLLIQCVGHPSPMEEKNAICFLTLFNSKAIRAVFFRVLYKSQRP